MAVYGAYGLVWGIYDQGILQDTFRYMEDGSFNTAEEMEYAFPEEGMVGLVHPAELEFSGSQVGAENGNVIISGLRFYQWETRKPGEKGCS